MPSKLSRRSFLAGSCCALHAALLPEQAFAKEDDAPKFFSCATIEPPRDGNSDSAAGPQSITPYGTAFMSQRWRREHGLTPGTGVITLGVAVLNGSPGQQRMVRDAATQWTAGSLGRLVQLRFVAPPQSQIRVAFTGAGNYSAVGTDNLRVPMRQHTMSIQDTVPHVIQHEFGHALGLQHEHMHPNAGIVWNEQVVIREMARQGWSPEMTRANILSRFNSAARCVGDPNMNLASIMLYPIPRRWTLNGFQSGTNGAISQRDVQCLMGLYS